VRDAEEHQIREPRSDDSNRTAQQSGETHHALALANPISADALRSSPGALLTVPLFPPLVSLLMLDTAVILSIFKPWRRTPWSKEPVGATTDARQASGD
jgi:hypothetical protein